MEALDECHARGFLYKALGNCNAAKTAVNKCLRAERIERQRRNREDPVRKEKQQRIRGLWKDIDENS